MSASVADALTSDNDGIGYLPARAGFRLHIPISASLFDIPPGGIFVNGRPRRTGFNFPEKISGEFLNLFFIAARFMLQGRRRRLKAITSIHHQGGKAMEFSIQNRNQGRKMTGMIFAVLFHIALAWGLLNGLGGRLPFAPPKPPIDITVLSDPKPVEPPPPALKPIEIKPVKIDFIPPPVVLLDEKQENKNVIREKTAVEPEHENGGITRNGGDDGVADVRVPPVVDAKACERPDYPSNALRNGTEGVTGLQFLIGVDGKVLESKVARSSGSRELDRAALAGLTRCIFKAGTVNGKPVASWTNINYEWRIE